MNETVAFGTCACGTAAQLFKTGKCAHCYIAELEALLGAANNALGGQAALLSAKDREIAARRTPSSEKAATTKRAEWLSNPHFQAGQPLAGIGTFWDAFEKDNGRAPTWDELEPALCKALDAAEKSSRLSSAVRRADYHEGYADALKDSASTPSSSTTAPCIDRSEAVNLARNWLDETPGVGGWDMTQRGIRTLAEAVMRMDEHIRSLASANKASSLHTCPSCGYPHDPND